MVNGSVCSSVSHALDHIEEDSSITSPTHTTDDDDQDSDHLENSKEEDCTGTDEDCTDDED